MSISEKYRESRDEYENILELLTTKSNRGLNSKWKERAHGMHKLADHYESVRDHEVAEVYNELIEDNSIPSQIVAEEAAFKYATEDLSVEEAIEVSREEYS